MDSSTTTPNFKDYKKYKPYLRTEFNYTCVYCEAREAELAGSRNFGIDHYKPKKIFPFLTTIYENLLYACNTCNSYKGAYWPNPLQSLLGQVIINPRIDNITDHINTNTPMWRSKSSRGEWNIQKLRLSSDANIKRRDSRRTIEKIIEQLKFQKSRIDAKDPRANSLVENISKKIAALEYKTLGKMD